MAQYIDKAAALAIIEKFMYDANQEADIASTGECYDEKVADAKYQLCKCIKDKINSLKPQSHWKPSKETLESLEVAKCLSRNEVVRDNIEYLLNKLKKL